MADTSSHQPQSFDNIALFLQGGGALGSYEGGAYEALDEVGLLPNIVGGISIGAFGGAIIASTPPQDRVAKLKAFWNEITRDVPLGDKANNAEERAAAALESAEITARKGVPGLAIAPPHQSRWKLLWKMVLHAISGKSAASYYLNSDQESLLKKYVDFDALNAKQYGVEQFGVGTTQVGTKKAAFFDNINGTIKPEHIMASAAIAPVTPMVPIDGVLYEDGWFSGNNSRQWAVEKGILGANTLSINVHLSDATQRPAPYNIRKAIQALNHDKNGTVIDIYYHHPSYELHTDAADFSRSTKDERWKAGYADMIKGLCQSGQLDRFSAEVVQHLAPHLLNEYPDVLADLSAKVLSVICSTTSLQNPKTLNALTHLAPEYVQIITERCPAALDNVDPTLKTSLLDKLNTHEHTDEIVARRETVHATGRGH